jgi:hypothetical protein
MNFSPLILKLRMLLLIFKEREKRMIIEIYEGNEAPERRYLKPKRLEGDGIYGLTFATKDEGEFKRVTTEIFSSIPANYDQSDRSAFRLSLLQSLLNEILDSYCPEHFRSVATPLQLELNGNIRVTTHDN